MVKITKRDMALIQQLRGNSRLTLTQISKKTKIPISTLFDRLKAQQDHSIMKHTTLLNFDALGYGTRVQLSLVVDPREREALQQHLLCHQQVNSVFEVAQQFDFIVEGIFKQVREVKEFLSSLQGRFPSLQYTSQFITRDLKRETFLAQ